MSFEKPTPAQRYDILCQAPTGRGKTASSGIPIRKDVEVLKKVAPAVVTGTPGRIKDLG